MGLEITIATTNGVRIAYFCPKCNELQNVSLLDDSFPKNIARAYDWNCIIDFCTKESPDTPYIVIWRNSNGV